MIIPITNSLQNTEIFIIVFLFALLISWRSKKTTDFFPVDLTSELKGLAILMITFSHIGYFLVNDHSFLWPLSISAGVGVNLFLFLSGYGLAVSKLKKEEGLWQFYKKHLVRLFVPMWIILIIFAALDFFILKISYSWKFIGQAILGIFTHADLYHDLNSPLWYFSFILFYYLLFPLVFSKKRLWLTALALYFIPYFITRNNPAMFTGVIGLYKVHLLAFPLGVLLSWLVVKLSGSAPAFQNLIAKIRPKNFAVRKLFYYLVVVSLLFIIGYFSYYSGIGTTINREQNISLITTIAIICLFLVKRMDLKLFYLFGIYSYEIYLLHWPIMYRYDLLYRFLPAWLATVLYLFLLIGLAELLKRLSKSVFKIIKA